MTNKEKFQTNFTMVMVILTVLVGIITAVVAEDGTAMKVFMVLGTLWVGFFAGLAYCETEVEEDDF